jgi:hypothetical protein
MLKSRDAVLIVKLVNFVRNLPFYKSDLMIDAGSHKVHQVHKVAGNGSRLSPFRVLAKRSRGLS